LAEVGIIILIIEKRDGYGKSIGRKYSPILRKEQK
jgi:hypothetical protein